MGLLSELQLRTAAYLFGVGEFAGNVFRNAQAHFLADSEWPVSDLKGKTCIITGGNAGIGFATAQELARRGCRVILACRSLEKANKAAKEIQETSQHVRSMAPEVEVMGVSLSSLQSVRDFCEGYNRRQQPLDYLILNAGIMGSDLCRRTTDDGFEEHFQVNYLSQWLMAHRLLGEQRARRRAGREGGSDSTRVIFLTSSTHMAGGLDLADLQLESGQYSGFRAYTSSKLAAVLAARQMQDFLDRDGRRGSDVAVAVHPGLVRTSLAAGWMSGSDLAHGFLQPLTAAVLGALGTFILEPPSRAARTLLYAALAPAAEVTLTLNRPVSKEGVENARVKGQYVAYGRVRRSSRASHNAQLAQDLWQASLEMCGEERNAVEDPD